jgi:Bacterial conjugation TrbI-like protein
MNNQANDQQHIDQPHTNDRQHYSEPSLSEMESIMDFDGDHGQKTGQKTGQTKGFHGDENDIFDVEAIEEEDAENNFLNEEFNPEKNITKVGFRKNGIVKGALVGVTGLVLVVGGITFFQGQAPKEKVAETPKKKDPATTQIETAQTDATKAQQSESEIKAELALSKQKDALEQSNSSKTDEPNSSKTTDKSVTDSNTKVVSSPAPSVPTAPLGTSANVPPVNKSTRASGFVTSPVVPPIAIPSNSSTKLAAAPASKNNVSIPPAGIQPLQTISAPKLATAPVGSAINKNANSAPAALPNLSNTSSSIKAIAKAPGITNTPLAKPPVSEPAVATPSPKTIARVEPTRSKSISENPIARKRSSEEPLTRLGIALAPGVAADTNTLNNTPPPPLYPVTRGINSFAAQPPATPNAIPPVAINSAPTLTDFLKTSAAADTPNIPVSQPQIVAMNKDQSKEKQLTAKVPKSILQLVPTPTNIASNKGNLIASGDTKGTRYSGLVSPNSLLSDIVNSPPFGISIANTTPNTPIPDKVPLAVKPALTQGVAPGSSGTRPAYAYTKMLLAGLPDTNTSLGNAEQFNNNNQQVNQVNKSQIITQNNPVLNQPTPTPPEPNTSITVPNNTVPGTPVSPVSPIGPIAASILTGTSAKGTTLTPILWGAESATGAKFVAKLEEPLLANNKREALPAGTQLIIMAKPSNSNNVGNNNNSLVEVDVVGVIVQGKEYTTPPGAIVIHDENNGLLVGEDYFKREDQIASRDYMTVLGGALNTLGQVLNRPSGTFSSNTSGFGSSSTNIINNRDPNIFGALLEGGFKDIPGIWTQRNQQALAQLANQPKVYQIPKGRTIRVFVNQSIIF